MPPRSSRSYKSDESFLEKISIGAAGTKRTFDDLSRQGHTPIELERGSMSYKIWKSIKIKRLRVPDLLCVKCGMRVESRAKTKLEITMSHSKLQRERGWDFGLRDEDFVALVICEKSGVRPIDWKALDLVQYISVQSLREAFAARHIVEERPKGAQEGFEIRVTWPAAIASADGTVREISESRIKIGRESDGRTLSLALNRKRVRVNPLVTESESVREGQIVAAPVSVCQSIACTGSADADMYLRQLESPSVTERYAAVKALGYFDRGDSGRQLRGIIENEQEHIYVRLEAAATLMRQQNRTGADFIRECLKSEYLENRLEAVITLSEIAVPESRELLISCLCSKDQNPDIRAGAAWALGELDAHANADVLMMCFADVEPDIRVEAARALAKIANRHTKNLVESFPAATSETRPGLAWAIAKAQRVSADDLLPAMVDTDARQWISYVIGTQPTERFVNEIEKLKSTDAEVYFAVTVLWKIYSSWIHGLEEY